MPAAACVPADADACAVAADGRCCVSGEEMRARMIKLLGARGEPWPAAPAPEVIVDAVLPVVRAIVAEELRAAAAILSRAHDVGPARRLRNRADALEAGS